jgi:hypothetical protein
VAEYHGTSHDGNCGKGMTDAIAFELAELVPSNNIAKRPLARILRERSWRNLRSVWRDGCAKPRGKETCLNSMLTDYATSSPTARLVVGAYRPICLRTAQVNVAAEVFVMMRAKGGKFSSRWEDHAGREVRVPWLPQLPVSGTSHRAWRRCSQDGSAPFAL